MADKSENVESILDRLNDLARQEDEVSVGAVVKALGGRSYGPFLMIPALIELSPIGGIPGVPTFLALIIILFAAQLLFGRHHFWLPQIISNRSVSADKVEKSLGKLRPIGRWLDRWFHGRLPALTKGPFVRAAAAACIILALTVPPLELFPFASSAPMAAIAMFGLALLVHDGALMIVAVVLTGVAIAVGLGLVGG